MKMWRWFCMWLVDNVPLGPLAPHVFHMGLGGKVTMKKVATERKE